MQVATTQDYATDSWFWTVFTSEIIDMLAILILFMEISYSSFINYSFSCHNFHSLFILFFKNSMHVIRLLLLSVKYKLLKELLFMKKAS